MFAPVPLGGPRELAGSLRRSLDRPAREALEIGRRSIWFSLAPALVGLAAVTFASLVAGLLARRSPGQPAGLDGLTAAAQALMVAFAGLWVGAVYLRLRVAPGALAAAAAVGLLLSGVVALSLLPLVAFLAVVSRSAEAGQLASELLIPGIALGAATVVPLRVLAATDNSSKATWIGRLFVLTSLGTFALQAAPLLRSLFCAVRGGP